MKKNSIFNGGLLLVLCILFACVNSSDISKGRFNGSVKSITCRQCNVEEKFGKWVEGEQLRYTEFYYDIDGYYTEKNDKWTKTIPKYDNKILNEEKCYNADGQLIEFSKINYISKSEIQVTTFDSEGKQRFTEKLLFKGKLLDKVINIFKNRTSVISFEYNDDGNIIKRVQVTDKETYTISRDDEYGNNISKDTTEYNKMYVTSYKYLEFDKKGNWIKRLVYENSDNPTSIEINEIVYYDNLFNKLSSVFRKKELQQEDAKKTIIKFMNDNKFEGGGWDQTYSFNADAITAIDPINQFDKKQANVVVHYNIREPFANDDLILKFIFKENVDNKWFLTSVESVQGIGTETLSRKIKKWNDLNISVQ